LESRQRSETDRPQKEIGDGKRSEIGDGKRSEIGDGNAVNEEISISIIDL